MYKYSLLIVLCLVVTTLVGMLYDIRWRFNRPIALTLLISLGLMLIFNTYLTSLPIVVYNMNSILGLKIITFPVEDIGYLIAVVALLPLLYEKLCDERKQPKRNKQKDTKGKS